MDDDQTPVEWLERNYGDLFAPGNRVVDEIPDSSGLITFWVSRIAEYIDQAPEYDGPLMDPMISIKDDDSGTVPYRFRSDDIPHAEEDKQ